MLCLNSGCDPSPNTAQVSGHYKGTLYGVTETIDLRTDGFYEQTVTFPDHQTVNIKGTWTLQHRAVTLREYLQFYSEANKAAVHPPKNVMYMTYVWRDGYLTRDFGGDIYSLQKT